TRLPRRTVSERELSFTESTNLAAALVRAWGMSRSAKLVPFSRVGIVSLVFDLIPLGDRMNWAVNLRLAQSSHRFSSPVTAPLICAFSIRLLTLQSFLSALEWFLSALELL